MPGVTARKQGIIRAKDARNQPLPSEEYNFTIIPPVRIFPASYLRFRC